MTERKVKNYTTTVPAALFGAVMSALAKQSRKRGKADAIQTTVVFEEESEK